MIAPPFGKIETMILSAIELADETLDDPDIEDHPRLGEHDGCEPDDDGEPYLGWSNPGGPCLMPEGWCPADTGEWHLNCEMLAFDGSGSRKGQDMLASIGG